MGNSRSTEIQHEKLEEHSEQYFAKVQARNKIKTRDMTIPDASIAFKKKKTLFPFKRKFSKSGKSRQQSNSTTLLELDESENPSETDNVLNVRTRATMPERAELPQPNTPNALSPSNLNQVLQLKAPKRGNKSKRSNRNRNETKNNLGTLPRPRGSEEKDNNNSNYNHSYQRNKKKSNHNNGIGKDHDLEDLQFLNDDENEDNNINVLKSQKNAFKIHNENRAFEASLSNGMIWTEIKRGGKITCLSFAPTGTSLLAVGSEAGTVSIIQIDKNISQSQSMGINLSHPPSFDSSIMGSDSTDQGKYSVIVEIPREGKVRTLDWSPDGRFLAVGGNDCTAVIIDVETLRVVQEIEREDRIYAVRWSPDGDMLAIGGFDGMVAIVSFLNDGEISELITEIPRLGLVLSLGWSSNKQYLAVGGSDKRAAIVHVENWEVVGEVQRPGSVKCLEWSPDGRILGVGGHDGVVAVIDIDSRTILKEIVRSRGEGTCRITDITWSPDGAFVTIAGTDNNCAIYETKSFVMVHEIQRSDYVTCVDWQGGEGKYLAVGGDDRSVAILKTGGMMKTHEDQSITNKSITESIGDEWSTSTGSVFESSKALPNWIVTQDFDSDSIHKDQENKIVICAIEFSHDSRLIAFSSSNNKVTIIETQEWTKVHEIPMKKVYESLSFSPSNEYLAIGSEHTSTCVISIPSFDLLTTLPSIGSIHCLKFSPDSSRLALGDADGILSMVSSSDWSLLVEMDENESPIYALDWSQDGDFFAIGRNNALCTIHECSNVYSNFWVPQAELIRKSAVNTVAFTPKGDYIAIGGGDWTVGVYIGKKEWTLCHELKMDGWILAATWSPSGQYLAIGGTDVTKGGVVVDATTWDRIEEYEDTNSSITTGIGVGEEVHCLSWTGNGKHLAVAGSGGLIRIIKSGEWKVEKSIGKQNVSEIEKFPIESTSDDDSSSEESGSSSGESRTELLRSRSNSEEEFRSRRNQPSMIPKLQRPGYSSRMEPTQFLKVSESFLAPADFTKNPTVLNDFNSSVKNLKAHVSFIHNTAPTIVESISSQKEGELLSTFCRILQSATIVMEEVLDDIEGVNDWWKSKEKFDLGSKDVEYIEKWNSLWIEFDKSSPIIDIGLLVQVDESDSNLFGESNGYLSIQDTEDRKWPIDDEQFWENEFGSETDPSSSWSSGEVR